MATKYDWSNVPPEVKWISTDINDFANGHIEKPELINGYGFWSNSDPDFCITPDDNPYQGDWRESLEQRPTN